MIGTFILDEQNTKVHEALVTKTGLNGQMYMLLKFSVEMLPSRPVDHFSHHTGPCSSFILN